MSTIDLTIASPRPLPLPRASLALRAAVEALEDLRQLVRLDPDTRVAGPRSAPRRRRRRRPTSTAPPGSRELDRVADEVRHDLADPLRVVADPERRSEGSASRRPDAPAARRGDRPARRPIRPRPGGRRGEGRGGRARNRASRARAGSGRASRAARAGPRLLSRNSARASGPSPACSVSSSLKVRRAAIGVRSSCETSARKSRLRSRSRRILSTLSSTWSAIALNWVASAAISDEPARMSARGIALARARPRRAPARPRSGGGAAS